MHLFPCNRDFDDSALRPWARPAPFDRWHLPRARGGRRRRRAGRASRDDGAGRRRSTRVNATCTTRSGRTYARVTRQRRRRRTVRRPTARSVSRRRHTARSRSLKPDPTRPAKWSAPSSSKYPTSSAPTEPRREPWPSTHPPTTSSWRLRCFTLSHCTRPRAGLVVRRAALGDDALEPELPARREHRRTVLGAADRRRRLPVGALQRQARAGARGGRGRSGRAATCPACHSTSNTISATGASAANCAWRRVSADVHALLQPLEAGPAVVVERHDLAVEHHRRVDAVASPASSG